MNTQLDIDADALAVREIGPWLQQLVADLPAAEQVLLLGRLELAVHEVCMNCVDHAGLAPGARLALTGTVQPAAVTVTIADGGVPFDADGVAVPVAGVPQIRGYGLMIVRKLVDELRYTRDADTNHWALQVDRVPTAPATEALSEPAATDIEETVR